MRSIAAGLSAFVVAVVMAGCADSAEIPSPESSAAHEITANGPWAEAISSTYEQSSDSRVKEALSDNQISGQEVAFFKEQIIHCLSGLGLRGSWAEDGSLTYSGAKSVSQDSINSCNRKNGLDLITLNQAMNRNPQNLDESEIMVACLKRVQAVGREYTARMFSSQVGLEDVLDTAEFEGCNSDPLNYKK